MRSKSLFRSTQGRFRSALLLALGLVPTAAFAQTTITGSTTGPIYGDGNSITVTSSGVINGNGGLISTGTNTTTTLTNSGSIEHTDGIFSSATIGSVTNSTGGLINGSYRGMVQSGGSVGQFANDGSVTAGLVGVSFEGGATLGTFTN